MKPRTKTISPRYRSSAPDRWTSPRQALDASQRLKAHGPVQPMQEPGFFARLFAWRGA